MEGILVSSAADKTVKSPLPQLLTPFGPLQLHLHLLCRTHRFRWLGAFGRLERSVLHEQSRACVNAAISMLRGSHLFFQDTVELL